MSRIDDHEDDYRQSSSGTAAAGMGLGIVAIVLAVVGLVGLGVIALLFLLLVPAVQKVRSAAARMSAQNNLKQIALALHNYHDTHGRFPPPSTTLPDGRPGVSWRVLILPFIEQEALHRMYRLDEPWDSPNNAQASSVVIKTFCHPGDQPSNMTRLRIFVGGGAAFDRNKKTILGLARNADEQGFADGTANTLLVVEAGDLVPWAKPDELDYGPGRPLPKLGHPMFDGDFQAAFADGSVRNISRSTPEATIRALITANGNEGLPADF